MKRFASVALAAALLASTSSPAHAQLPSPPFSCTGAFMQGSFIGGSNFATAMSGCLTYSAGVITLEVRNEGTFGEVFASIGLTNVGPGITVNAGTGPTSFWQWDRGGSIENGGDGVPVSTYAYGAHPQAPANGLQPGAYGVFTFNVGQLQLAQYQNMGIAVHAISGPQDCSTKLAVWNDGASTNDARVNGGSYSSACAPVSVPEPESMALVLTGLVGLAFVALRRREDETEI